MLVLDIDFAWRQSVNWVRSSLVNVLDIVLPVPFFLMKEIIRSWLVWGILNLIQVFFPGDFCIE